MSMPKPVDKRC